MHKTLIAALLGALAAGTALATTEADVENSFNPYKGGFPKAAGLTAGTVINKGNAEQFKDAIPAGVLRLLKEGLLEIKVGPTTQFELSKAYVEATRKNLGKAKLGPKNGDLEGYVAGRPFPEEPDAKDPRAGEKLAWNYKYGVNWGDGAAIYPFYWKYRNMQSGQVEKTIKFNFHFLNFKHRVKDAPVPEVTPNPSELFRAIYVKALDPQDLKNTQLLIQRYEDDQKLDDAYLYLGFQRRVRRLATGQTTDAFLGSDLMIEDFEGYNGRISDMKWTYKGTKNVILPMWNHNELKLAGDMPAEADGYKYVDFGGQGGCFHNGTWQLRKVYVLEAAPVNPNHPISKRVFYMDAQLGNLNGANEIYDRKGELWKVFMVGKSHPDAHLPINKGAGIGIDDAFSMVDVQSKHCTTGQFKGQVDPKLNPPSMFQVQYMRGGD
ncbi:MAG TPA: DUF1329 domain-containing protein [Rhodocyclaceae bacterium]|uniref:DUF1329 domain-containing protein n=1 Tax=Zoogloea sp. TaxID=49181 RepID=UPI002B88C1AE|nr:DUF1329 domain-containing protein [Zoogloea sp.]HMV63918.1 DUF1329 domain-containing protein [Rhodocyclaceae bacterium]HMY49556.1 DUF1329 domain-containing protein [Rhodocyclaceae bacterium]HNA66539.1 DUF1329 domain-containing protein [Rhodocyclaceae bacterium]HNB65437.1 DUF1329 domain-containing protein [Rhodocyclaceae bacterium]HNH16461.1 DUF1329 domain-containing protein [Zoogloea sp.]